MMKLNDYITNRKKTDSQFAEGFDEGYKQFKIGVLLKELREEAGLTQQQLAEKLNTKKSAISRIESHAEDIRLTTLQRYANALGKKLEISII
ncbi:MAG: helix-turn-helix transcriptional regulator [Blastocatellia bacterium]